MKKRGSGKRKFSLAPFSFGKRGMIEIHFNWIFVLIAGAIIFVFFINIVNKQREFSEIKTSGTIITNLESILTGAQVSTNTVNIVDMPKVDIGFECNRYFIGPVPKQTRGNIIFSPGLLKGKKLITWALDWNMPYRVTNFLYITDPELRYVIVYDDDTEAVANRIYGELPKEEMNKDVPIHQDELGQEFIDKNNYKVKFIFLGDAPTDVLLELNKMPDEDVTAIVIKAEFTTSDIIPNVGTIEFYKKQGNEWGKKNITYYLKKESLFGAIFAEDAEMYDCVMRKAFEKLNLVTEIYFDRSEELRDYYGIDNIACANAHSKAIKNLENMRDASGNMITNFPDNLQDIGDIEDMQDYAKNIGGTPESANGLAQLYSCALIY